MHIRSGFLPRSLWSMFIAEGVHGMPEGGLPPPTRGLGRLVLDVGDRIGHEGKRQTRPHWAACHHPSAQVLRISPTSSWRRTRTAFFAKRILTSKYSGSIIALCLWLTVAAPQPIRHALARPHRLGALGPGCLETRCEASMNSLLPVTENNTESVS